MIDDMSGVNDEKDNMIWELSDENKVNQKDLRVYKCRISKYKSYKIVILSIYQLQKAKFPTIEVRIESSRPL